MNICKIFKNKAKYLLLITLFYVHMGYCQVVEGMWNSLTSFLQFRDVEFIDDRLYVATEGGILLIDEDEYSVISNIDGLNGVDILSIEKDDYNNLWIGGNSPSGFLQSYDPLNYKSLTSFDLQLTSINDIHAQG